MKLIENNKFIFSILILAPLLLYFKSIYFDFSPTDEQWLIVNNAPYLESIESFKAAFTTPLLGLYYRPLFLMTIILDYQIGKLSPQIYHFTNLLWHVLAVILLYKFLSLSKVQKKPAFIYSLLFAVHPIMLQAVAWVPGRNDLMLCVFILFSLIYLNKYLFEHKRKYFLLHLLFFIFALFTKENAVILPVVFFATYITYQPLKSRSLYLFVFCWLIFAIAWFILRQSVVVIPEASYDQVANIKNSIMGILIFLGKFFLPIKQSVYPTIKNSTIIPGILSIVLFVFLFFRPGIENKKTAILGLSLFFGLLILPVWFGATKGNGEHFEHRAYTSYIGLILFISQVKFNTHIKLFYYVSATIIILFCVQTFKRIDVYKDKLSYLNEGVKSNPDYYFFQLELGNLFYAKGDYIRSIPYYNKAIELRPDKTGMYQSRAVSYYYLGMYDKAILDFTKAIDNSPFHPEYYLNRCISYNKTGDIENAYKDLLVLIKCCDSNIPADLKQDVLQKWITKNQVH